MTQKFFNIKESCKYLGINRTTFDRWLKIGLIPAGFPVSKNSQRRVWTKSKLDQVENSIDTMTVTRE